ncbi:MAG: hypothetical protein QOJ28_3283, partial [Mycobacterium sp.]|nr:hypothetical protein [Mycobacterium sp.]
MVWGSGAGGGPSVCAGGDAVGGNGVAVTDMVLPVGSFDE